MSKCASFTEAALLFFLLASARSARAESPKVEPLQRVELHYVAGSGCPSEAAFSREVKARIRRPVTWVDGDASARHVSARTEIRSGHARGSLEIIDPAAEPTLRQFDAETCGEVASALALVVALALDPNARTAPLPAQPEPARGIAAPAAESTVPSAAPTREQPARIRFSLGPAATVASGYAPKVLVGLGAMLGARYETGSAWSPALQLTPVYGTPAASVEQADFRALLLRVDVCPIALRTSRGVSFAPCLSSNIGQMKVGGKRSAVASPDPKGKFWVDLGLSAELRLVSEPLFMALSLGGFVPIKRYSYGFDQPDQQPFFTTSAVLASGLLALGVEL